MYPWLVDHDGDGNDGEDSNGDHDEDGGASAVSSLYILGSYAL